MKLRTRACSEGNPGEIQVIFPQMPVDTERILKPMRKLHKLLAEPPKGLNPEKVHGVRTRCSRVQSTLRALGFEEERRGSELIAAIETIRKKAGKVRDADVLTSLAAGLSDEVRSASLTQLVEELGVRHERFSHRLGKTISRECRGVRAELKRFRKRIEKQLAFTDRSTAEEWSRNVMARSLLLSKEIAGWPRLRVDNLHPFRLKVKDLRIVLQLSPEPEQEFIHTLRDVKDAVGEWHDWSELSAFAADVLGDNGRSEISKRIKLTAEDRLQHALRVATHLRERYFGMGAARRGGRKRLPIKIKEPVLRAAAKMAA